MGTALCILSIALLVGFVCYALTWWLDEKLNSKSPLRLIQLVICITNTLIQIPIMILSILLGKGSPLVLTLIISTGLSFLLWAAISIMHSVVLEVEKNKHH